MSLLKDSDNFKYKICHASWIQALLIDLGQSFSQFLSKTNYIHQIFINENLCITIIIT